MWLVYVSVLILCVLLQYQGTTCKTSVSVTPHQSVGVSQRWTSLSHQEAASLFPPLFTTKRSSGFHCKLNLVWFYWRAKISSFRLTNSFLSTENCLRSAEVIDQSAIEKNINEWSILLWENRKKFWGKCVKFTSELYASLYPDINIAWCVLWVLGVADFGCVSNHKPWAET